MHLLTARTWISPFKNKVGSLTLDDSEYIWKTNTASIKPFCSLAMYPQMKACMYRFKIADIFWSLSRHWFCRAANRKVMLMPNWWCTLWLSIQTMKRLLLSPVMVIIIAWLTILEKMGSCWGLSFQTGINTRHCWENSLLRLVLWTTWKANLNTGNNKKRGIAAGRNPLANLSSWFNIKYTFNFGQVNKKILLFYTFFCSVRCGDGEKTI